MRDSRERLRRETYETDERDLRDSRERLKRETQCIRHKRDRRDSRD